MTNSQVFTMQVWHSGRPLTRPIDNLIHNLEIVPQHWSFQLPTENVAMPLDLRMTTRGIIDGWLHFDVHLANPYGAWITPQLPGIAYCDRWSVPSMIALTSQDPKFPGYFALTMQAKVDAES